ncbi:MAG: response regulator [Myxococcales bacterium]|nr:response regulator [Polyangiaceae bacterium]MDW8249336.1 response regulator [Myxococcales bacterium]
MRNLPLFLDRGLLTLPESERFQRRAYRIFLLLFFGVDIFYALTNLLAGILVSAFLCGSCAVVVAVLLLVEWRSQLKRVLRLGEFIAFALTISLIGVIAFTETPSRSEAIFFMALPLLSSLLVQGRSNARFWLFLGLFEFLVVSSAELIITRNSAAVGATIGHLLERLGFLGVFWLVASEVRRPLEDAQAASEQHQRELQEANTALSRALRTRSEFLANMSHEIRTPLHAVIGATDLLLETSLHEDQRELVQTIQSSGRGLLVLLNDILDLARLESGRLQVEQIAFPLRPLLFDALDLVAPRAEEKGLVLIGDVALDVPTKLDSDPARLRQILLNLLGNAVKFTEQGHVILRASVQRGKGLPRLRIVVEDTGIGLSTEQIEQLFQPFHQGDVSIHRTHGGTGLGLAICHRLVGLLEGQIGAESKKDEGAIFWIELPLRNTVVESSSRVPWLAQRAVLIVEPNPHQRAALARLLGAHLVSCCDEVENLEAAVALVHSSQSSPALVIVSDAFLGELAALERLQEALPESYFLLLAPLGAAEVKVPPPFRAILSRPVRPERLQRSLLSLHTPLSPLPAMEGSSQPKGACVLIVEDNPVNQRVISRMVQKLGHGYALARSGEEALRMLEEGCYDLVLMDMRMPGMDGLETTRELRRREGGKKHTIVVAATANAFSEDREQCLHAGMDDFLAKPVRMEELQAMLLRWLPRASTVDVINGH